MVTRPSGPRPRIPRVLPSSGGTGELVLLEKKGGQRTSSQGTTGGRDSGPRRPSVHGSGGTLAGSSTGRGIVVSFSGGMGGIEHELELCRISRQRGRCPCPGPCMSYTTMPCRGAIPAAFRPRPLAKAGTAASPNNARGGGGPGHAILALSTPAFPGCPERAGPAGAASFRAPSLQPPPPHTAGGPPTPRVSVLPASGGPGPRSSSWTREQRAPRLRPEGAVSAGLRVHADRPVSALVSRPGPLEEAWSRLLDPGVPRRGTASHPHAGEARVPGAPCRERVPGPAHSPSRLPARLSHGLRGRGSERRRPAK